MNSSRILSLFLLAIASATPLAAQTLDRDNSAPTGWAWYYGQTATQISAMQNNGYRIVSLDVESTSPLRFAAAFVKNSGSYARSSRAWYYGSPSFVEGKRAGRRVTALTPYVINNTLYLAASFVANTGANVKSWGYYYGSSSFIQQKLTALGGRIVDLDSYVISGKRYYTAVIVKNSGADQRAWWWYLGATASQVSNARSANNARLIDFYQSSAGRYDCVMVRNTKAATPLGWWYYNLTASALKERFGQNGARLISLQRVGSLFNACMINNSNALTTSMGTILRNGTDGVTGCYLARVGTSSSSVLCSLNAGRGFEPASTIKTVAHFASMERVSKKTASLTQNLRTYLGMNGSCPTGGGNSVLEPLSTVLRLMMENSDNARTLTTVNFLGRATLNARAKTLGMTNTSFNHTVGCGGPTPNVTTLNDLGLLHATVDRGALGSQRDTFYNLMINKRTYPSPSGSGLHIDSVIGQEAAKLKLSASRISAFRSAVVHASKGGNYNFPSKPSYHGSYFSHLGLPTYSNGKTAIRNYAVGTFFNNATKQAPAFTAIATVFVEMLRSEIKSALATWVGVNQITGTVASFGKGCVKYGNSWMPALSSTPKTPEIGKLQKNTLAWSRAGGNRPVFLSVGASKTRWGSIPLPYDLKLIGAPGCMIHAEPVVNLNRTTGQSAKSVTVNFTIPMNGAFVGAKVYMQGIISEPQANTLGVATSNGVELLIGGLGK